MLICCSYCFCYCCWCCFSRQSTWWSSDSKFFLAFSNHKGGSKVSSFFKAFSVLFVFVPCIWHSGFGLHLRQLLYCSSVFKCSVFLFWVYSMHTQFGSEPSAFLVHMQNQWPILFILHLESPPTSPGIRGLFPHFSGKMEFSQSFSFPQCCAGPCHLGCTWGEVAREKGCANYEVSPTLCITGPLAQFLYSERWAFSPSNRWLWLCCISHASNRAYLSQDWGKKKKRK